MIAPTVRSALTQALGDAVRFDVPLSIDTRKAPVAEAACDAGATLVNDVSGLRHDPQLAEVAARHGATRVLGHMRGEPATMQDAPHFDDVVREVLDRLVSLADEATEAGVADVWIDPGIGFGGRVHRVSTTASSTGAGSSPRLG